MAKPVQPSPSSPSPEEDAPNLSDILDVPAIQSMMDAFYELEQIGMAIIDLRGNVLVATGWQDVCTKFHRVHPETRRRCMESDVALSAGVAPGEFKLYRCRNNLWDMATPIVVGGRHVGNFFLGQFFIGDERPDVETFRAQARQYGFDEREYLAALERVPRWNRDKIDRAMAFYSRLAQQISDLGYRNLQLTQALADQKRAEEELRDSKRIIEGILHAIPARVFWKNRDLVYLGCNEAFAHDAGFSSPEEVVGKDDFQMGWRDQAERYRSDDRQVIESGRAKPLIEEPQTTPDGKTLALLTSKIPLRNDRGDIVGVLGTYLDVTGRRQAEESLRLSEEKFSKVFQTSPYAILITRAADGLILDVNDAFAAITGFSKSQAKASTTLDLGLWAREEDRIRLLDAVKSGQPATGLEFPFRTKRGTVFTGLLSSQMIQFDSEPCLLSSIVDITERKKSEEKLRAGAEQFRDVASNIPGAIYQLRTGRTGALEVPYMTSGCEALFERPLSGMDFAGLLFNHMHLGDRALFEHSLAAAAARLERWSLEFRVATPDGRTKWLRGSANPRKLPDGRILWNGVLLDISEQKRAEQARRESEERFHLLVKNSSDVIAVIDAAGTLKYVSPAEQSVSGFSAEELTGKSIADIIHPEDRERALQAFREAGERPEAIHRLECRHLHKTREWVPVEIVGQSFLAEPAVRGVIVSVRDVSARKQAEEEMARQLDELRRWQSVTLGRESRVAELKREVNALAARLGQPRPYPSAEESPP